MKLKKFLKEGLKCLYKIGLVSLIVLSVFNAPFIHRKYIRNIAEESVVMISSSTGRGTGFHVKLPNGRVVILTNKHVCEMNQTIYAAAEDSVFPIEVKIIKKSSKHDLCVIEGLPDHEGISIGSEPVIGDILFTLGHPRGEALNVAVGEYFDNNTIELATNSPSDKCEGRYEGGLFGDICIITQNTIQISTPTYPGNSGSAIVNKYGNLVAVVFAGDPSLENSGHGVPLSYIKEFLNSI
jgi:S1-C subfamily serine protease